MSTSDSTREASTRSIPTALERGTLTAVTPGRCLLSIRLVLCVLPVLTCLKCKFEARNNRVSVGNVNAG